MKVMTVLGTRPEIIRLSRVIALLDRACAHTLVHTGQNSDPGLSDVFFRELGVRAPDRHLGIATGEFAAQAGQLFERVGTVLSEVGPDRLLVLGDTNSGLSALVAARRGIPVYHMEAGNRAYDDRVPEELNRRVIDHASTILMPYTHRSKENLLREGIERERIFVTGNPIYEVLQTHRDAIDRSDALSRLGVARGGYFLLTMHRAENVDDPARLRRLVDSVTHVAQRHGRPVLFSVHPRTADKLQRGGLTLEGGPVRALPPLGFIDFVKLEREARAVLSDSGTVQEECSIFRVPNVTIRDVTERPETIECGSNILSGAGVEDVQRAVDLVLSSPPHWSPPPEYLVESVAATVVKIVLGRLSVRRHG